MIGSRSGVATFGTLRPYLERVWSSPVGNSFSGFTISPFNLPRELMGVTTGTTAAVGQPFYPAILVAVVDLAGRLTRDPELITGPPSSPRLTAGQ